MALHLCPPHDWDVEPAGGAGTENTYEWTCKDCGKKIKVDI